MTGLFILSGCQTALLPNSPVSRLDQEYRIQRALEAGKAGVSVQAYRSFVSPSLSSHCKWSPSDSQFAVIAQKKCGAFAGGLMAFARFLNEEDAARMGFDIVNDKERIKYVDLPNFCWL